MTIHRFQLRGEFIPLNDLLKLLGLTPSGGAAKALIAEGAVAVDGDRVVRQPVPSRAASVDAAKCGAVGTHGAAAGGVPMLTVQPKGVEQWE